MRKSLYMRLALGNVRRSRDVYVPYFIATAIMASVYFIITALVNSRSMTNTPSGETARLIFSLGLTVFTVFVYMFMMYINGFLIKRRRREFGLYGVLGLSKRHIGRVLRHEMSIVIFGGVLTGMALGAVLGRLLFMALMRLMHTNPGSTFDLPPTAFVLTGGLFVLIYISAAVLNGVRVHMTSPAELMRSQRAGEKDSRFVMPMAAAGGVLLIFSYGVALFVTKPLMALSLFFPDSLLVIIATYLLFTSGSIVTLRLLRANKKFYYRQTNFVAVSGMFHRMRQNARSLATICIVSTMLLVVEACSVGLYASQESILSSRFPVDLIISTTTHEGTMSEAQIREADARIGQLADEYGITLTNQNLPVQHVDAYDEDRPCRLKTTGDSDMLELTHTLYLSAAREIYANMEGSHEAGCAFTVALRDMMVTNYDTYRFDTMSVYIDRQEGYGLFGGILFLGAFFSVVFLTITVLLIYFKQITEGYEDKQNYEIMRKVGMDQSQIKRTVNRQISLVFFLPLMMTLLHIAVATPMMARMLSLLMIGSATNMLTMAQITRITYICAFSAALLFAAVYFAVFRATSRVYLKIVR